MDAVMQLFQKNRDVYGQEHRNFTNMFGAGLMVYWDNLTGFDVVKFDEEFLKSPDGKSVEDITRERYGDEGVRILKALLFIGDE